MNVEGRGNLENLKTRFYNQTSHRTIKLKTGGSGGEGCPGEQPIQPDSSSQNHIKVSGNHFQSLWMVSNQDFLFPRLLGVGRTNFLIRGHFYPCPHQTGIFPETSQGLQPLANRDLVKFLELVASSPLWPLYTLLSGYGMLSRDGSSRATMSHIQGQLAPLTAGQLTGRETSQLSTGLRWRTARTDSFPTGCSPSHSF